MQTAIHCKKSNDISIYPPSSDIEQAVKMVHRNPFHPELTVGWLREQGRLNGESFSARFKHYVGRYPKKYIIHHRIEMGKILLTRTDATNTNISLALGFSCCSTFSKAFKSRVGQPPSTWRKQQKSNHSS